MSDSDSVIDVYSDVESDMEADFGMDEDLLDSSDDMQLSEEEQPLFEVLPREELDRTMEENISAICIFKASANNIHCV